MEIVGKQLRVSGSENQHNEMRKVYDGQILKVPAGLIGRCDLVTPDFIRITFRRHGNNINSNALIWKRFSDLSANNLETGVLVAYLHPSRLRGMEVEAR